MKYLLWVRSYRDNTGAAWDFETIDAALKYARQYRPYSDVFVENKMYIENSEGEIVMTSKEVKAKVREHFKNLHPAYRFDSRTK